MGFISTRFPYENPALSKYAITNSEVSGLLDLQNIRKRLRLKFN